MIYLVRLLRFPISVTYVFSFLRKRVHRSCFLFMLSLHLLVVLETERVFSLFSPQLWTCITRNCSSLTCSNSSHKTVISTDLRWDAHFSGHFWSHETFMWWTSIMGIFLHFFPIFSFFLRILTWKRLNTIQSQKLWA